MPLRKCLHGVTGGLVLFMCHMCHVCDSDAGEIWEIMPFDEHPGRPARDARPGPRAGSGAQMSARITGMVVQTGVVSADPVMRRRLIGSVDRVAPRLLGARLISCAAPGRVVLRIVEVEAYGGTGEDPGSHAFRRQTPRNASMFGPAGHAYIYFTYGMHWCFNVVVGPVGSASAVLVRAGYVVDGQEVARARRPSAASDLDLARGPARLTKALGIEGDLDGVDLFDPESHLQLHLLGRPWAVAQVTARTGVAGAGAATPWRFAADHPSVSPYRAAQPRRREGQPGG